MRMQEVRDMTSERLGEELGKTHKELFSLRFQKATRQLADSNAIRKTRKQLARIQTALRERQPVAQAREQSGNHG